MTPADQEPTMPTTSDDHDERAAFEAWASTQTRFEGASRRFLSLNNAYIDFELHGAWKAWQARASLAPSPAAGGAGHAALRAIIAICAEKDCTHLDGPTDFAIANSRWGRLARIKREAVNALAAPPAPSQPVPWRDAFNEARDAVLNERGPLEGEGADSGVINAVLAIMDDAFAPCLADAATLAPSAPSQPVPATDVLRQCRDALSVMLTHMGMDEDEWNRPTFNQARAAVAAADAALSQPVPAQPVNAQMLEALRSAVTRMDRARGVLTDNNPRPECNWGMLDASDLRDVIAAAEAAQPVPAQAVPLTGERAGWQPIATAPENMDRLAVVRWKDNDGDEQLDLDRKEDGCWQKWHDYAEHVEMIGGYGVSYTPPYTDWHEVKEHGK